MGVLKLLKLAQHALIDGCPQIAQIGSNCSNFAYISASTGSLEMRAFIDGLGAKRAIVKGNKPQVQVPMLV